METSYSIVQKESEYRILLTPANLGSLSDTVLKVIADKGIDVSELIIDRISGENFTHIFDSYMSSHQVSGVTNTPIRLDNYENGMGYSLFFYLIARDKHNDVVEMLKEEIREVSGK